MCCCCYCSDSFCGGYLSGCLFDNAFDCSVPAPGTDVAFNSSDCPGVTLNGGDNPACFDNPVSEGIASPKSAGNSQDAITGCPSIAGDTVTGCPSINGCNDKTSTDKANGCGGSKSSGGTGSSGGGSGGGSNSAAQKASQAACALQNQSALGSMLTSFLNATKAAIAPQVSTTAVALPVTSNSMFLIFILLGGVMLFLAFGRGE